MKSIMISIKPEWVAKILNGEKTIEIRKSQPKCELPCKVYIYCTKPKKKIYNIGYCPNNSRFIYGNDLFDELNGKVVAEFTLKWVEKFECSSEDHRKIVFDNYSCLSLEQVRNYCNGQTLYGWYINDLIIYDKPKELAEFGLKLPPQNWCYVEGEEV